MAVCLVLTGKLWGLHPVFHVTLLCRYKPSGDGVEPPPPIVVDKQKNTRSKPYLHTEFNE